MISLNSNKCNTANTKTCPLEFPFWVACPCRVVLYISCLPSAIGARLSKAVSMLMPANKYVRFTSKGSLKSPIVLLTKCMSFDWGSWNKGAVGIWNRDLVALRLTCREPHRWLHPYSLCDSLRWPSDSTVQESTNDSLSLESFPWPQRPPFLQAFTKGKISLQNTLPHSSAWQSTRCSRLDCHHFCDLV